MNAHKVALKSGSVKVCEYTREDFEKGTLIREVVSDIYSHLPDFNDKIIWIAKVTPNENVSTKVVLGQYIKLLANDENKLIFAMAGTLKLIPEMGDVKEARIMIEKERGNLLKSGFENIIWNRRMSGCFGNPDVFLYVDDHSTDWVNNNIGDNDSKIINRVVKS